MRIHWMLFAAAAAWATPCSGPLSACDMSQRPVLFVGEVIEGGLPPIDQDPRRFPGTRVRFRVIENLRGLPADAMEVEVRLETWRTAPTAEYSVGKRYLMSPTRWGSGFIEGPCFHGRELPGDAAFLAELRRHLRPSGANITGRVAASGMKTEIIDSLLELGHLPPLAGVILTATREGNSFHTATDHDGRFEIAVPEDGVYELRAGFAPARPPAVSVEVKGGCGHQSFALRVNNSVAGRIVDGEGRPAKAQVVLEDLDRPGVEVRRERFWDVATGEFDIQDVPAGRYRLVANPMGALPSAPFARAVHPGDPVVITATGTHVKDLRLVVGPPVAFRDVTVRVELPDGSLVRHVRVKCSAVNQEPELRWTASHAPLAQQEGVFRVPVPADRAIRIEVEDHYGRALKRPLVATLEPGSTPVEQVFVIEP